MTPPRDEGLPAGSAALRAALEAAEPLVRLKAAVDVGEATGSGPETDPVVGAMAIATVDEVLERLERFCVAMRDAGIHVGLNHRCVICREPWPCEVTQAETAVHAFDAGVETARMLEGGVSYDDALERCVEVGWMERAGVNGDGEKLYRLTEAGMVHVEAMGGAGGQKLYRVAKVEAVGGTGGEPCSDRTG